MVSMVTSLRAFGPRRKPSISVRIMQGLALKCFCLLNRRGENHQNRQICKDRGEGRLEGLDIYQGNILLKTKCSKLAENRCQALRLKGKAEGQRARGGECGGGEIKQMTRRTPLGKGEHKSCKKISLKPISCSSKRRTRLA